MKKSIYLSIAACISVQGSSNHDLDVQHSSPVIQGHEEWIDQTQTSSYHNSGQVITIHSTQLIKALVEKNYDLAITLMTDQSVNKPTSTGLYPIHYVIEIKHQEVSPGIIIMLIKELAKHGVNLNQPDNFCRTPLMLSIHHNIAYSNEEAFGYFIANLSPEQINTQVKDGFHEGQTALLYAAQWSNEWNFKLFRCFIKKLIAAGANKDIRDTKGRNAFDICKHPIIKETLRDIPSEDKELFEKVTALVEEANELGNPKTAFDRSCSLWMFPESEQNVAKLSDDLMNILTVYGKYLDSTNLFYQLGNIISKTSSLPNYQILINNMKNWIMNNYTPNDFSKLYDSVLNRGYPGTKEKFRLLREKWPEFFGTSDNP